MAVDYCWRQLAWGLRWVAPAYVDKVVATFNLGVHKYSLQYDVSPHWRFWVQVGICNIGSLSGKGEVCEELRGV